MLTYDMIKKESNEEFLNRIYEEESYYYFLKNADDLKRFLFITFNETHIKNLCKHFWINGILLHLEVINSMILHHYFLSKRNLYSSNYNCTIFQINDYDANIDDNVYEMMRFILSLRQIERN